MARKNEVIRDSDREYAEFKACEAQDFPEGKVMSESAKTIIKDFDKVTKSGEAIHNYEDWTWEMLNRTIDYLREYVELGILK